MKQQTDRLIIQIRKKKWKYDNIVADGWAGAHTHTQTNITALSQMRVFKSFNSIATDRPTDGKKPRVSAIEKKGCILTSGAQHLLPTCVHKWLNTLYTEYKFETHMHSLRPFRTIWLLSYGVYNQTGTNEDGSLETVDSILITQYRVISYSSLAWQRSRCKEFV